MGALEGPKLSVRRVPGSTRRVDTETARHAVSANQMSGGSVRVVE
ncbi:hypothetical protein ACFQX7_17825 [Luedemannella flava]